MGIKRVGGRQMEGGKKMKENRGPYLLLVTKKRKRKWTFKVKTRHIIDQRGGVQKEHYGAKLERF